MADDPADADVPAVREHGIKLLARREHAPRELERKLCDRGYAAATVAEALAGLIRDDLLSESRYAESFARQRAERGQGRVRIRAELTQRGVGDGHIEQALAELDVDWAASARAQRRKRFGPDLPDTLRERARQTRFLQQRGFDSDDIRAALRSE